MIKTQSQTSQLNTDNSIVEKTDEILGRDLLSPLLATGLFPGIVQRFIPWRINAWDRVRGLEYAFETAWADSNTSNIDNPLSKSYYDHWDTAGEWPALILNTTVVETGERLVISPFEISLPHNLEVPALRDIKTCSPNPQNEGACKEDIDFPLSTAAILSARFPVVTPVGWFENAQKEKYRLADGGYFDNSGLITAVDIGQVLENCIENLGKSGEVEVRYISLIGEVNTNAQGKISSKGLNETGATLFK